ncbi:MAG: tRNA (cytidine/uridine-2'-O-)-methyltransferase TrmJ [Gemmatales bacterium]|nr:MAG: tRNA (cytidine/uridine-2'-O-)-methyltransferase TrmJ [Gemmatales bacterium]
MLNNLRVVLVRPKIAGNLGAVARVMRNMGFSDLRLVAPEADPESEHARQMATHGVDVLKNCQCVATLADAVADCGLVVGSSARVGGPFRRQSVGTPKSICPKMIDVLPSAPAALVFGPERNGLSDTEITRCHYTIHIPTVADCAALNLAQSVAICLYELRMAFLEKSIAKECGPQLSSPPANFAHLENMFARLQGSLEKIHFLYPPGGPALMHALRHLLARALPTAKEVDILLGLARQIEWASHAIRHRSDRSDDQSSE